MSGHLLNSGQAISRELIISLFSMMRDYKPELLRANVIAIVATLVSIPIPLLIPLLVDEVLLHKGGWITDTIDTLTPLQEPL